MLATLAHSRQVDQNHRPYIDHPMTVAAYAVEMLPEYEHWMNVVLDPNRAAVIGMLHDTIEDTWVTAEILDELFPPSVAVDVTTLSFEHVPGMPSREARDLYLDDIMKARSPYPWLTKIADLRHNTQPDRLQQVRERDLAKGKRLALKYLQDVEHTGLYESPFARYFTHLQDPEVS